MSPEHIIVFVTVGKQTEAEAIARALVKARLAACAGILPQNSIYWWQGKITEDKEFLLVIKTTKNQFKPLREKVLAMHSYEVPEIISIDIKEGHSSYLDWITESVTQESQSKE